MRTFTAQPADIDELGHVNNSVWVRWVQDMATAHWIALAPPEHVAAYVWVVIRHEIDFRGNIRVGETAGAQTWVDGPPRGAKFTRHVRFAHLGRSIVEAKTVWAMLDRTTLRAVRVSAEVAAPFLADVPNV